MTLLLLRVGPGMPDPPSAPTNTAPPAISGTTQVGETLTATNGFWTGSPTPTYSRQWKRDGAAISGATASTYLLVLADLAATITVTVTATNASGTVSATSAGVGPVTSAPAAATWNPADKAASVTLSGGDLVATSNLSGSYGSVRATKSITTGKAYFELTGTFATTFSYIYLGLATAAKSLTASGSTGAATVNIGNWSQVEINGSSQGFLNPFAAFISGDVICVALDLTNQKVWFRRSGNVWNAGGTADPAANVGGFDVSMLFTSAAAFPFVQCSNSSAVNNVQFNGGASAFSQTIPSGFVAWNSA